MNGFENEGHTATGRVEEPLSYSICLNNASKSLKASKEKPSFQLILMWWKQFRNINPLYPGLILLSNKTILGDVKNRRKNHIKVYGNLTSATVLFLYVFD